MRQGERLSLRVVSLLHRLQVQPNEARQRLAYKGETVQVPPLRLLRFPLLTFKSAQEEGTLPRFVLQGVQFQGQGSETSSLAHQGSPQRNGQSLHM